MTRCLQTLGRIMLECHESYSRCGLGCAEGDIVRDIVVEAPSRGHPCLVGCRLSGGGCGGVVCVLLRREGEREVEAALSWLSEEYEKRAGRKGRVHRGSSMGAAEFGVRVARYVSGSGGVGEWEVVEAKHPEKDGGQAATKGGMGRTEQSFH